MDGQPRLLDQVRKQNLSRHYSIRTERVYCKWVRPHGRNWSAKVEASHADFAAYGCVSTITQH
jgi:ribosomal protein L32E